MPAPTLAARLAKYATELTFEKLTPEAVHEAKRRVIDSLATAVGAMPAEAYHTAKRCALRVSGNPGASLLGGGRSSPEWAAFVNGLLIRYLDFNDTYLSKEPAHPSDNFAAVFAAGEAAGRGGRDLITAAVLAYEIQCRFCDAASLRRHGVDHVTYGAISSAVAAGKLLGLDAGKLVHAVGIAGVCNVALRQTRSGELSEWKGCAFANAARNGVFAATLAGEGLSGPAPIFEGDLGFFRLVSQGAFDPAPFGAELGNFDGFMINKTYIKFWPAEYHSQSAIDAALRLRQELGGDVSNVKSIDIETFEASYNIIGKYPQAWTPKTRETADHSLPYCTAAALMDGDVYLPTFDEARFTDPALLDLTGKVQVHLDDALSTRYPKGIPNRITVTLNDGRKLVQEVEFPRGHAGNPMTDQEVEAKFRRAVEPKYGKPKVDAMLARCWDFESLPGVGELIGLFD
ncbi:MmgE/PrpD family protein [Urbifossiella limnaea]|uniref:2-methylcitrate dehydratase n=1 Tax=Urbifossiella limnaea TaxID=2528023 RepID=A0A517XUE8_9BACT|nr:MmgE/PrpD family protein [Urbifossiella limnaea]QDU21138.1 2-methylcitrate dehydratase [Urbifossiella limnaea]